MTAKRVGVVKGAEYQKDKEPSPGGKNYSVNRRKFLYKLCYAIKQVNYLMDAVR